MVATVLAMTLITRAAAVAALALGLVGFGAATASAAPGHAVVTNVVTSTDPALSIGADVAANADITANVDLGLCIRIGNIIIIGCQPCPEAEEPTPEVPERGTP